MELSIKLGNLAFWAAASFLLGIFAANMGWDLWPVFFIALFSAVLILLFFPVAKYLAPFLFVVLLGVLYYHAYIFWQAKHTDIPSGKQAAFFGLVTAEPKPAGNFTMLTLSLQRPYAGTVDIFLMPSSQFHYGDELWVKGNVSAPSDVNESAALFLPTARVVAEHQGFWLEELVIDIKDEIVKKIAQELPADQAALLTGIMVGATGTMSVSLKAQMEASGTSYITGMYGYKIAIISFALAATLKDRIPRKTLLVVTLIVVTIFVFASGAGISAIRAAIMGSIALLARGAGRAFNPRNALTFAALGMVLLNASLLTDAGFQLSFLSFVGIYYLGDPINNFFRWADKGVFQWKEHAMLSLTTNLAILPIVMNTFGQFSLTSFISNILIMIPWVAILALGAFVVVFGYVAPPLAFCAAQVVSILLRYELFIIHAFSVFMVPMPAVFGSAAAIALYYGALILFAHYYAAPSSQKTD